MFLGQIGCGNSKDIFLLDLESSGRFDDLYGEEICDLSELTVDVSLAVYCLQESQQVTFILCIETGA
jgi:hypothetical protein